MVLFFFVIYPMICESDYVIPQITLCVSRKASLMTFSRILFVRSFWSWLQSSGDLQGPPELSLHTYPDPSLGIVKSCIDLLELALFFNFSVVTCISVFYFP